MVKKKQIKHAGIVADVDEEELDEIALVNRRKKEQQQPEPEKYWTSNSIEAERLVSKGVKLINVLSPFGGLPKRFVFDITKEEAEKMKGA